MIPSIRLVNGLEPKNRYFQHLPTSQSNFFSCAQFRSQVVVNILISWDIHLIARLDHSTGDKIKSHLPFTARMLTVDNVIMACWIRILGRCTNIPLLYIDKMTRFGGLYPNIEGRSYTRPISLYIRQIIFLVDFLWALEGSGNYYTCSHMEGRVILRRSLYLWKDSPTSTQIGKSCSDVKQSKKWILDPRASNIFLLGIRYWKVGY